MKLNKKYIGWVFATILLGSLGSGLWEYVIKPTTLLATNFVLELATLGVNSFKNELYVAISKGFHEKNSLSLLTFIFTFTPGLFIGVLSGGLSAGFLYKKIGDDDVYLQKNIKKKIYISITFLAIFMATTGIVYSSKVTYENRAITHFEQLITICRPYIDDQQEKIFKSNFSQIENKNDYKKIIQELELIAQNNNQKYQSFTVW